MIFLHLFSWTEGIYCKAVVKNKGMILMRDSTALSAETYLREDKPGKLQAILLRTMTNMFVYLYCTNTNDEYIPVSHGSYIEIQTI